MSNEKILHSQVEERHYGTEARVRLATGPSRDSWAKTGNMPTIKGTMAAFGVTVTRKRPDICGLFWIVLECDDITESGWLGRQGAEDV